MICDVFFIVFFLVIGMLLGFCDDEVMCCWGESGIV